jgi:hypothetical protein
MIRGSGILMTLIIVLMQQLTLQGQEVSPYNISRLSINTPNFSEISPVMTADGILFCSDRRLSGITDRTSFDNRRLYNLYFAERKDSAEFKKPVNIKSERSAQFNTGPLCISSDGQTIYFTSEIETGIQARNRKFRNHSGIFIARLSGDQLISITPFRYNSQQYDIGQPSLSNDGKYLYFASDMPGGYGRSDIYYCEFVDGDWTSPVNMGPKINSPETDNFPCIHPSGRLYFASNRPGGMGGLDVYSSDFYDGSWDDPVALAQPVNSAQDDFAFNASSDLKTGYFASNRRRSDDIYGFTATIIRKASCDKLEINNYCYEFVEENAVKYDSIPFLFEWNFGDGTKAQGRTVEHCYPGPGRYLVQLDVTNMVTGEIKFNEKSQMLIVEDIIQPYITCPDIAEAGAVLELNADSTNLPGWDISQYYWNFGDETIAMGKDVKKSFHRPGTFSIQLIVSSKPGEDGIRKEACVSKEITVVKKP